MEKQEEEKQWCFDEYVKKQKMVDLIVEKEITHNIRALMKITDEHQTINHVIANLQELCDLFSK